MAIPIGLVEDNPVLRKRLIDNFSYFPGVELLMACTTAEEFINRLASTTNLPEIILMDIELPGITGIEATRRIKTIYPDIEIIMFTIFEDVDKIFSSIKSGAAGYLLKDENPKDIIKAIEELKAGGAPMSPLIARKIIGDIQRNQSTKIESNTYQLSEREIRILEYLVDGQTYTGIAEKLIISPHTVKTHIKNIYKKMHVHSRAGAVSKAIKDKLV